MRKNNIKSLTIGYSVLSEYRKCPEKFKYRYLQKLSPRPYASSEKGSPLTFGELVHKFMELFYTKAMPAQEALRHVVDAAAKTELHLVQDGGQRSIMHLSLLLQSYLDHYGDDPHSSFEPIIINNLPSIETEVNWVIKEKSPRIIWRQHFDGLVLVTKDLPELNLKKGEHVIFEHKTSSGDMRTDLKNRMIPNDQIEGYIYGARRILNLPVSKVIFNGLGTYRKLVDAGYQRNYSLKYGKEPMPLFYRECIEVSDNQLDRWREATDRDLTRLVEDINDIKFSRNAPDACTLWGSRCSFAKLCASDVSTHKDLIANTYIIEPWKGWEIEYEK